MLLGAFCAFPLMRLMPQWTAWESGPLEGAQNFILLAGGLAAMAAVRELRTPSSKALLAIAALFWIAFLGRELAWGAVFVPPEMMTEWGPSWSSKHLWYRPAVPYVLAAMGLLAAYWWLHYRVWSEVVLRLARERALPLFALGQFVAYMVLATNAEGHGFVHLEDWYGTQVMVLEELMETLGYLALLLAQAMVVFHLRQPAQQESGR